MTKTPPPVLLAQPKGSPTGPSRVIPVRAGNPNRASSGKFGSGGGRSGGKTAAPARAQGAAPVLPKAPGGVDAEEIGRRGDLVRQAAREFDAQALGDLREFLQGRTTRALSEDEFASFEEDVRIQRLDDLVDLFDQQLRSGAILGMTRGRRKVKISAPQGWQKRTLNGLSDDEIGLVARRLVAMGHSAGDLRKSVFNHVRKESRRKSLELVLG